MLFNPALGLCPGCIQAVVPCASPQSAIPFKPPIFVGHWHTEHGQNDWDPAAQKASLSLFLSLSHTNFQGGQISCCIMQQETAIHAVPAVGWAIVCSEYKLFGPILSYSDVRSSCSSVHSPIHCLPLLKKEVLQEEMNCIPKSWACTLLCSTNSDPDPGAHGKCLVLGEVYLTPVCWTVNSLG